MHIVANKADVSIIENKYRSRDLNNSLSGTLYYWSLKASNIIGG